MDICSTPERDAPAPKSRGYGKWAFMGFYLTKLSEYVVVFGLLTGVVRIVEHFIKFKIAPKGMRFTTATPQQGAVTLRSRTSDLSIYWEVFLSGEYNVCQMPIFEKIMALHNDITSRGNRPLIVDAGANIGLASVFFASLFPVSDIIAIEPSKQNCEIALINMGSQANSKLFHRALWPSHTSLQICPSAHFSTLRVTELKNGSGQGEIIETVTMAEILECYPKHELFIVKMDIEGAERVVLSENNGWLSLAPVIFVEPHDGSPPHGAPLAGLMSIPIYQRADIIPNSSTLIFVPERKERLSPKDAIS